MKLGTLNHWLKRAGIVLVVQVGDGSGDEPTELRIERSATYDRRTARLADLRVTEATLTREMEEALSTLSDLLYVVDRYASINVFDERAVMGIETARHVLQNRNRAPTPGGGS